MFREEGHVATATGSLRGAREALGKGPFDLVLLDWMLPDGDGIALCTELRDRRPPLPVIMLTARGEAHDRIVGLKAGADDYVVKPFDVAELVARVEAVHRRVSHWHQ